MAELRQWSMTVFYKTFVDVPVGSTFYNEIASMSAREIMVGRSETVFDLSSGVTLNHISNVAGRICGAVSVDNYQAGLEWAAECDLATGDKSATRMQVLLALLSLPVPLPRTSAWTSATSKTPPMFPVRH